MIPAPLFLDQVVPGWEWERADELNQALRRLGLVELGTIAHDTVRGILRFYPGDGRTPVRHNGQMAPVRTVYARSYTTELRHERWSLVYLEGWGAPRALFPVETLTYLRHSRIRSWRRLSE
ncbi:PG_binding_1 domain-containing protein [Caenorhabditis elegans]|uniref:PG_binding_1 domain-containing protein n=1 Tax=Caenorhabditis elegans TaxID=6239 RepID=O62401_CAEEL|nr:PG_binding_1 domain-containing protein [Caenorhabditis elegans]CAA16287.2 PG_binding_1 domain-containing protein [Caenorhabditis elegans]|eukprot:NP_503053.2 Uncharacterized protein CELE_Y116A8B.1 [Caenorhabditis elegans]